MLDAIAPELHEYAAAAAAWLDLEAALDKRSGIDASRALIAVDAHYAFERAERAEARVRYFVAVWDLKGGAR
jgi:hypothetical protein